ncbi:MAG TPA: hypothetical protein VMS23_03900, partial [Terrimicrobiaceae bacterium]|nr:hypothetical protein [Terrimicrobiaceae bacterium]
CQLLVQSYHPVAGRPRTFDMSRKRQAEAMSQTAEGGVKITYSQVRIAPSRAREKPVRARGKLI